MFFPSFYFENTPFEKKKKLHDSPTAVCWLYLLSLLCPEGINPSTTSPCCEI